MTGTLGALIVEAAEPEAVARFWQTALGDAPPAPRFRFRRQERPKSTKNRVHLDLYVRELESLLTLGARVLAEYPDWVTLADVEGNEFCAFPDPGPTDVGPPARVFAVCTDSDRPEELAAWWAPLVSAEIGNGPDGTPRWLYGSAGWEPLIWKFVRVDDERTAPNRWQWTIRADSAELLAAGARNSSRGVLVDPQGNDFSVEGRKTPAG